MANSSSALTSANIDQLNWDKAGDGLIPAVVQDAGTGQVLMVAWMSRATLFETLSCGEAVFHSRSRGERWRKGETSGHFLSVVRIHSDCDADTLLIEAIPHGPACHRGTTSCFGNDNAPRVGFLGVLDRVVDQRRTAEGEVSYTAKLFEAGIGRMAQKVGEEGIEAALAAVSSRDEDLLGEAADLVFHLIVLLRARGLAIGDVVEVLRARHAANDPDR